VKAEIVQAITADAHAREMTVTGHIPQGMTAIEGINDGMDQINHINYELPYFSHPVLGSDGKPDRTKAPVLELDGPRVKDLISTLRNRHTILDPTVALMETFMNTKPLDQLEPGVDHLPPQLRQALDSPPANDEEAEAGSYFSSLRIAVSLLQLNDTRLPSSASRSRRSASSESRSAASFSDIGNFDRPVDTN
jgi:hypothetical protein